jgi:undecaprenyl diphosphate synthase
MTSLHVAVTMDGNGRWAERRGLPRSSGHREGARAVRRVVEAATASEITTLTLYAFSSNNWRRPRGEVLTLMSIFDRYLHDIAPECLDHDIAFTLIGRRDRLPPSVRRQAASLEQTTAAGKSLALRLAIDYSARDAIWCAVDRLIANGVRSRREFECALRSGTGAPSDAPDVDLLIRTGGEQRLSDFLLWQSAHSEFYFVEALGPDLREVDFLRAIRDFTTRDRRYGG